MSSLSKPSLTRIAQAPCLSNNSMTSKHFKTTMFRKFREEFECPHFPKLPLLRCPNFLRIFLPFRSVGFCLRALGPSGRGSRGETPLHYAAANGHVSAVARLIEAKAEVDAQTKNGRGLGRRIWGGKPSWGNGISTWRSGWNAECFTFCGKCFAKTFGTVICVVLLWLYCSYTLS